MQRAFGTRYGYGWVGQAPKDLARMLVAGGTAFEKIKERLDVDAVAFMGSSGCAIGFHLAVSHKIPLIYVRKDHENSHGSSVESSFMGVLQNYVIVDDFIDSGTTAQLIATRVKAHAICRGVPVPYCVGIMCYDYAQQAKQRKLLRLECQDGKVKIYYAKDPDALS